VDALVIKTIYTILEEAGAKNLFVTINSIGDKDSRPAYIRELTNYYKKHIDKLAEIDRERLKTNPLRILDSKEPATIEINQGAPDAVSFFLQVAKNTSKKCLNVSIK
jgi:histidyl-tRNA synthetase